MSEEIKIGLIVVAVTVGLSIGLAYVTSRVSCAQRWADSGMESRYSFTGGCQVQHKGVWIPADRYRAID